jgi:hypothetical protein
MTGRVYVNLLEGFLLPVTFCDIRKNHGHWTDNGKSIEKTEKPMGKPMFHGYSSYPLVI